MSFLTATSTSVHGNLKLLSSYVDDELSDEQRARVESHLEDCSSCRERLAGLNRVVFQLQRLERTVPPSGLGYRVERSLCFRAGEPSLLRRSEASLRQWLDQPSFLPLFGVILALGAMIYLFSILFAQAERQRTRVVVPAPVVEETPAEPVADGPGNRAVANARIADKEFVRTGDGWVEAGLPEAGESEPEALLDLTEPRPEYSELEVFRTLGGRVRLSHQGTIVLVNFGDDVADVPDAVDAVDAGAPNPRATPPPDSPN